MTEREFGDFELRFEWKIAPGGNSGVKYRVPEDRPPSWERAYMRDYAQSLRRKGPPDSSEIPLLRPERWRFFPMGFEFQIVDDIDSEDARSSPKRRTAALYDIAAPERAAAQTAGRFHQGRIRVLPGGVIEHWADGVRVLRLRQGSRALKAAIAASKFRALPGFGQSTRGRICLQDHGSEVWFRALKIRSIPPQKRRR